MSEKKKVIKSKFYIPGDEQRIKDTEELFKKSDEAIARGKEALRKFGMEIEK